MIIYHGSLEIVNSPEIRIPSHTLDYGSGFYTTTSYEQAESWVKRKMVSHQSKSGYINSYAVDELKIKECKCLIFNETDENWLDFVMKNRTELNYVHDYDIVYGPVANDKVYTAFSLYESGVYGKEELLKELKTYRLVDQYLFHTELSLNVLSFINSTPICSEK